MNQKWGRNEKYSYGGENEMKGQQVRKGFEDNEQTKEEDTQE